MFDAQKFHLQLFWPVRLLGVHREVGSMVKPSSARSHRCVRPERATARRKLESTPPEKSDESRSHPFKICFKALDFLGEFDIHIRTRLDVHVKMPSRVEDVCC